MSSWTFLREFLRQPSRLGSVTPSSPVLARKVVETAAVGPDHVVLELGAGTGPITAALVDAHPDNAFLALEPTAALARLLRERFPTVPVRERFADRHLPELIHAWGHDGLDRVVSGLPWTMWTDAQQDEVFAGITAALRPGGRFLTYSYVNAQVTPSGRRFRRTMHRWFDHVWTTPVVWANVPPAIVVVGEQPKPPAS